MKLIIKAMMPFLFLLFGCGALLAQQPMQEYRTMRGNMIITGKVGDTALIMQSNRLIISLNYETAELIIRVNKKSVSPGYGSTFSESPANHDTEVLFKGKLGLDYINTQSHPPLDFKVEGYIVNNSDTQTMITGTGHLEHIFAGEYACILDLDFEVSPELLDINWPGEEKVTIQIIQTILKRVNE
ncbi:MAG: hypothetical protein LPK25_15075 [Cyclobacteriaceae bacterium]|uniref:hypothetical protein n=1 Tax=Croceimicrobium sp. TaxID=2828340 RepID=UPI0029C3BC87|nr:hypothetical protein [Cyclobacteriaceae bacterium]